MRSVITAATRLRIGIKDAGLVDRDELAALGARGVAFPRSDSVHVILGPSAPAAAAALRELLTTAEEAPARHDAHVQASSDPSR